MEKQEYLRSELKSISPKDLVRKVDEIIDYLKLKRQVILIFCLIFCILGSAFSFLKKPVYTAESTFVLEENDAISNFGQISGLASMVGINLDNSGGGLFRGDNIIELYKSRRMLESTLLSDAHFNGKNSLIIDYYLDINDIRKSWKSKRLINLRFSKENIGKDYTQDSVLSAVVNTIRNKYLDVSKPDKKLSIISVKVKATDEGFAEIFSRKLVSTVNNFYVDTKTKKSAQNIAILQRQTDSIRKELNESIGRVASENQNSPNANPLLFTLKVPSQRKQVDVQANSAIYSEIVKNLEIAKISLRRETPLIQNIDVPVLPLPKKVYGLVFCAAVGLFVGFILSVGLLVFQKIITEARE